MTAEEIQALFDLKLDGADHPRWGGFDRSLVGVLLEEITRLKARIAELEKTS